MAKEKKEKLSDKLFFNLKSCWEGIDKKTEKEVDDFASLYKNFLDNGKTERECAEITCKALDKAGFVNIDTLKNKKPETGMKIYKNIHGKSVLAAVIGRKPASEGFNILGAHIDSPRLDLKPRPLYEDS
ncbi:MAG: aminopeptidase, partial [Treponema sp.]|nr:aminopeptidase [Treponema sp.]